MSDILNQRNMNKIIGLLEEAMLVNSSGTIIPTDRYENALKNMTTRIAREHIAINDNFQSILNFKTTSDPVSLPTGHIFTKSSPFNQTLNHSITPVPNDFTMVWTSPNLARKPGAVGNCFLLNGGQLNVIYRMNEDPLTNHLLIQNNGVNTTWIIGMWSVIVVIRSNGVVRVFVDQTEYLPGGSSTGTNEFQLGSSGMENIMEGKYGLVLYDRVLSVQETNQAVASVFPIIQADTTLKYADIVPTTPGQDSQRIPLIGTALADLLLEKGVITQAERDAL